ncbi:MAG: hypothetical protein HQM12_10395 [SAR324 cluster bacterium]|nr:hypothetical protein [SAR324 cluster bacterium]
MIEAESPLIIFDEINFTQISFRRQILLADLSRYNKVLTSIQEPLHSNAQKAELYKEWCKALESMDIKEMREVYWTFCSLSVEARLEIQSTGHNMFGDDFTNLEYELEMLADAAKVSLERIEGKSISFACRPLILQKSLIFSASANPDFLQNRLGVTVDNPFGNYRFIHSKTKWYNFATSLGTKTNFEKNSDQILDFFAKLIIKRAKSGKRILLVVKKVFEQKCEEKLNQLFQQSGSSLTAFVDDNKQVLSDQSLVPIIHYGTIGTNRYEDFDCCYCLSAYYLNENILNDSFQEVYAPDIQIGIKIQTDKMVGKRGATVAHEKDRFFETNEMAQHALVQNETAVVVQAVGRVRPFTNPREIITFQYGDFDQFHPVTKVFGNLQEAREIFKIDSKRQQSVKKLKRDIQKEKKRGRPQKDIATLLGVSIRTVQRYWK